MDSKFLRDIVHETAEDLRQESEVNGTLKPVLKNDVERVLRTAFNNILTHLANGDKVYVIDFLNFEPRDYKAKTVKNPQTQEPMVIEPYRTILSKPSKHAKKVLKNGLANSK